MPCREKESARAVRVGAESDDGAASVVVVGAGLSGLACALRLYEAGLSVRVFERSRAIGGRCATREHEGFLLDRGFQLLLTSYPEARRIFDYEALGLRAFYPGALVRYGGAYHRVGDPFRRPEDTLATIGSPIGTLADKFGVVRLRNLLLDAPLAECFARGETTTYERLVALGFSQQMIDQFFRPFLAGLFFERELTTSSRVFDWAFRLFAVGDAALPAKGMAALPRQLAARLPQGCIEVGVGVAGCGARHVQLMGGERVEAEAVVVASGPASIPRASSRVVAKGGGTRKRSLAARQRAAQAAHNEPSWRRAAAVYFDVEEPPITEPILALNGDQYGVINTVACPSVVQPGYAPAGRHLVCASVVGDAVSDAATLQRRATAELRDWFGKAVSSWRHLETVVIDEALPAQPVGSAASTQRDACDADGVFVCGDTCDTASINGALASGIRAAEAVLVKLELDAGKNALEEHGGDAIASDVGEREWVSPRVRRSIAARA